MSTEKLLKEIQKEACSCDAMLGWTCRFCKNLLPELRSILSPYKPRRKSPYVPRTLPRERWA